MLNTPEAKSDFLQRYANVVAMSWADDDYLHRLLKNPNAVLGEAGIPVKEGARINVVTMESTGHGTMDNQLELWEKGAQTGVYDFVVALKPEGWTPENVELSDAQLMAVAGGLEQTSMDIDISCCCCSPCCCCT